MKFAFCLFKYFPYGGLQRDFLRIVQTCLQHGHHVHVYAMRWEGKIPSGVELTLIPVRGLMNHQRVQNYVKAVSVHLAQNNYDRVIGFNKMPGLDIYYAADSCFAKKVREKHGYWYRLSPRYRCYQRLEKEVFNKNARTKVLLISPNEKQHFIEHYQTPETRFHLLPPGISRDRIAPANAAVIRQDFRRQLGIAEDKYLLLMIGSGFKTKGVDRALLALKALPEKLQYRTELMIVGKDNPKKFLRLAKQLNIARQVHFLGGRDDVPHFLLAADILVHPAYYENTGTVLLEALVAGLPVLTSSVCGYAHYIEKAKAGLVIGAPFQQQQFNQSLQMMLFNKSQQEWQKNALEFVKHADIFSLPERAVEYIEQIGNSS